MTQASDLVQRVAARLREEHRVDPGLDDVVETLTDPPTEETFRRAQRLLRDRVRAVQRTTGELDRLLRTVRRLRETHRLTEEGWPAERDRLARLADDDPARGADEWLRLVVEAVRNLRPDALRRLVDDGPLPPGYTRLRQLTSQCLVGLETRRADLVAPVILEARPPALDAGSAAAMDSRNPTAVLARLALAEGGADLAERLLAADPDLSEAPRLALRAHAARLRGDAEEGERLLADARALGPSDADVVVECLRSTSLDPEERETVARAAVTALPSLVGVREELAPLVDVPPALWLAVADRARSEGDHATEQTALDQAEAGSWEAPDPARVRALVLERRAGRLAGPDRARALLDCGNQWLTVPDVAGAQRAYAAALESADARQEPALWSALVFRLADCATVVWQQQPVMVTAERRRMLNQVGRAQQQAGAVDADPWCYGVEFELRAHLCRTIGEPRAEHAWRALLAAARNVALRMLNSRTWTDLADASGLVGARHLSCLFARHAVERLGDDTGSLTVWLTNTGQFDQALRRIGDPDEPWKQCCVGWIRAQQGRHAEAARILTAVAIDPLWYWAREALIGSLVVTGRSGAARRLATDYLAEDGPDGDLGRITARGHLAAVTGDLAAAERYASAAAEAELGPGYDEDDAAALLAEVRWLATGESAAAHRLAAVMATRGSGVRSWPGFEGPLLRVLTGWHGHRLDLLDPVDDVARTRLAELADRPDRLPREVPTGVPEEVVRAATGFATVLAAFADRRLDDVEAGLADLAERFPREAEAIHAQVRRLQEEDERGRADPVALSDDTAADPAGSERSVSPETPERPANGSLHLRLPARWFDGYDDPVGTHPVFTRLLPALRLTATYEVPPVRVVADAGLEDEFAVLDPDGAEIARGPAPAAARWCHPDGVRALPDHLRDPARGDEETGWWVPVEAFADADHVPRLLTLAPEEVAVEAVGAAAEALARGGS